MCEDKFSFDNTAQFFKLALVLCIPSFFCLVYSFSSFSDFPFYFGGHPWDIFSGAQCFPWNVCLLMT